MESSNISKFFAASLVGATLAVGTSLATPTLAQTNDTPNTNDPVRVETPPRTVDTRDYNRDDNGQWGWLGLLGLLGLAGLRNKPTQRVAYDDRPDVTSTTYKP